MAIELKNLIVTATGGTTPPPTDKAESGRIFFLRRTNVPIFIQIDQDPEIYASPGLLFVRDTPFSRIRFRNPEFWFAAEIEYYAGNESVSELPVLDGMGLRTFPWIMTGTINNGDTLDFTHTVERPGLTYGKLPFRRKTLEITNTTANRALTVRFQNVFNYAAFEMLPASTVFGASSREYKQEGYYGISNGSGAAINYQILETYYQTP